MNTCPNCGSPVLDGDPYCQHCGCHLSWSCQTQDLNSHDYDLDDVLDSLFINDVQKSLLKLKLESYLKAKAQMTELNILEHVGRKANEKYTFTNRLYFVYFLIMANISY